MAGLWRVADIAELFGDRHRSGIGALDRDVPDQIVDLKGGGRRSPRAPTSPRSRRPAHQETLTRGCGTGMSRATVGDGADSAGLARRGCRTSGEHDDVAAPPGAIDEAPFQGGRGPCVRSDRTAPDLDPHTSPTVTPNRGAVRTPSVLAAGQIPSPTAIITTAVGPAPVCGLTGRARPFSERAWQVAASLVDRTASGVLE
jgi:hypothetical protein